MKILLLTDRMECGGAETHVVQLARGLHQAGHEVALLCGGGRLAKELEHEGIRQIPVKLPTHNPFRLLRLWCLVRSLTRREGFSVLHAHTRLSALLIRGCARYRALGVVTVHARFSHKRLWSKLCYWGEQTVAVSEDLRAYVCDVYHVPAERVCVIPNTVDCRRFFPQKGREARNQLCVVFASRMDTDCSHGAELLCHIAPMLFARYPTLSIRLAGNGNALGTIQSLADAVNERIGATVIHLVGHVEDMPALLRKADVFVGVSRAALEACACGCAVILCGNEGYFGILNDETIEAAALTNFCARGLPPPTAECLQEDLCRLLASPAERRAHARACCDWVRSHRNAEQAVAETLSLYRPALSTPKTKVLTVAGYFGRGNQGDDAILSGLLHQLATAAPSLRILALTGAPRRDRRRFGITCRQRRNPLSILRTLLGSDALLFGGGSLLQDTTSRRSLWYYLTLIRLARLVGRPVLFCGAGIGPLLRARSRKNVKRALQSCRYVSLRDVGSLRLLTSMGVDPSHLHLGADPALLFPIPPRARAMQLLSEHSLPIGAPYLGIALRGGASGERERRIVLAALRMICNRRNLMPLFLILDVKHDTAVTKRAQRELGGRILHTREIADLLAVLSICQCTVSMRLHGLILAASAGCSGVGVVSDPNDEKIPAFARQVGMEVLAPPHLHVGNFVEAIERTLENGKHLRPILCDSVAEMRKNATKDLANIVEMIYNNRQ